MPNLSSRAPQVIIIMTTHSVPGDDKGDFMTTIGFQCNDTPNTWPMCSDDSVLSMIICSCDIFHHSEPFVEMLYESIFHTCHQTKLTDVNDYDTLLSFCRISYFHAGVSFIATKSIDRSETHVVFVYAMGFHSRDNNVRDEMLPFLAFCSHDYTYIHEVDTRLSWYRYKSMPHLTHWGQDKMTTILHIISKCIFFQTTNKINAMGVVDYKMRIG